MHSKLTINKNRARLELIVNFDVNSPTDYLKTTQAVEALLIQGALELSDNKNADAAKIIGMKRTTLIEKVKRQKLRG